MKFTVLCLPCCFVCADLELLGEGVRLIMDMSQRPCISIWYCTRLALVGLEIEEQWRAVPLLLRLRTPELGLAG